MLLAKVVGNLVSTHKNKDLKGLKFLFVQPLDEKLKPIGDEELAVDGVGAGIGDIVVCLTEGKGARQIARTTSDYAPLELVIAGIVDSIKTPDNYKFIK